MTPEQERDLHLALEELRKRIEDLEHGPPKASEKEPILVGQAAAVPFDVAIVTLVLFAFPALPAAVATAVVVILTHAAAALWARAQVTPNVKL